jgi:hypothetical protein
MAKLTMINIRKWTPDVTSKFMGVLRNAVENHDFDQGWVATPNAAGVSTVTHRLVAQPKTVLIYASSNSNGAGYSQVMPSYVDNQTIQFSTALPFVRVLANK